MASVRHLTVVCTLARQTNAYNQVPRRIAPSADSLKDYRSMMVTVNKYACDEPASDSESEHPTDFTACASVTIVEDSGGLKRQKGCATTGAPATSTAVEFDPRP